MLRWILASVLVSLVYGQCPDGFIHHGPSCYALPGTESSWVEATMYCRVLGAQLAVIETTEEQHFLEGMLGRLGPSFPHDRDFWIGGGDFLEADTWIWTKTREVIETSATHWGPGQPSNVHMHQACLRMSDSINYKWEDGSCDSPEYFICETPFENDVIG